jgi:hypothetical protein
MNKVFLILAALLSGFSANLYAQSKEEPVEIVTKTYNRVLVQANKDGPRVAIDEQEAKASAAGGEVSQCTQDSQSSSAKGHAKTSISKINELELEVNLRSTADVRGGHFLTCQESDPRKFPCDMGGCLGTTRNDKTAQANVSSTAKLEFRFPVTDSPDYVIKISKSGSRDLVSTLRDPGGKEIKLNQPDGKDPVLRRISGGSYYLNLDLPAVANKKGQDKADLDKSATVHVELIAVPAAKKP